MTFITRLEPQHEHQLYRRLEALALLGSLTAIIATYLLLGNGANELNPLARMFLVLDKPGVDVIVVPQPDASIWYVVGALRLAVVAGVFLVLRRLRAVWPRYSLSMAAGVAGVYSLNGLNDAWVLARVGVPPYADWTPILTYITAVTLLTALVYAAPKLYQSDRVRSMAQGHRPRWLAKKTAIVVVSILVVVSIIGPGVVMLPGVESDHSGTAAAEVENSTYVQSVDISSEETTIKDVAFNDDGSKMYIIGSDSDSVHTYSLSTAYDVSTASFSQSLNVSDRASIPTDVTFGEGGSKMYITGESGAKVMEYDLSTTYDISTATYVQSMGTSGEDKFPGGVVFGDTGSKMYLVGDDNDSVHRYDLSTAFDISTATHVQTLDVSGQDTTPKGLELNGDGSKLFVAGNSNDIVAEYDLSTTYDLSSATHTNTKDVSGQDTGPMGVTIENSGEKMYIAGNSADSVHEYNSDISGYNDAVSGDITGRVLDEAGEPVVNATVFATGIDTANPPTIDGKNYEKHLENPLPSGWNKQVDDLKGFKESPEYDTSEAHEQFDDTRVLMHTSENWGLDTVSYTGGMVETVPPYDVSARAITTPEEEQLFACWDFDQASFGGLTGGGGGDGIDKSILGGETTPCGNITIQRIDPLGDPQTSDTVEPAPLIKSRAAANIGWSDDTGWAVKHHYGYRTDLNAGMYRVYPEGQPSQAMYYVVAPDNDVSKLRADFENWLKDKSEAQSRWEKKLMEKYDAGSINIRNATTNSSGYYGLGMPDSVDRVDISAVKGGPNAQGTASLTRGDVRQNVQSTVEQNFEEVSALEFHEADREQLQKTCSIMDSVANDVSVPYTGQAYDIQPPTDEADIHGTRIIPKDLDERTRFCYAVNLAQQIMEEGLGGLFPGFQGDLDDLTRAELEERYRTIMNYIEGTPVLEDALDDRIDGSIDDILNDDPSDLPRGSLESRLQSGIDAIESPTSGGGGSGSIPGSGSSSPTIQPPDTSTGNETLNALWQVGNVDNWNDDATSLLIRIHYSNGSTTLLNRNSSYVTVGDSVVGSDTVRLEEYPLGETDPATVRVELDVATPGGSTGDPDTGQGVVRNPTFDGELPALRDMRVSNLVPGPSDNVSISVTPADSARFGELKYANVSHPECSYSTLGQDGELDIWTCGQGNHHVSVTFTNPGGVKFVETFQLDAKAAAQSRPPTVRSKVGPVGRYAITNGQLAGGDIQTRNGASVVEVIAIAEPGNIPNSIVASTTNMDVAKDSDTVVRVVEGDAMATVRKRIGVILHRDAPEDGSLLYRNARAIPSEGESPNALVNTSDGKLTMDSFTDERAGLNLRVNGDPSFLDRVRHWVSLNVPVLSLSLSGDSLLVVTPLVLYYRRRRKRPPNTGSGGQEATA